MVSQLPTPHQVLVIPEGVVDSVLPDQFKPPEALRVSSAFPDIEFSLPAFVPSGLPQLPLAVKTLLPPLPDASGIQAALTPRGPKPSAARERTPKAAARARTLGGGYRSI